MIERQASLEPPVEVLTWAGGPPMLCAVAGRQPWIDRISDRVFERSFQEALRRSVEAFRARERLGAQAFGSAAVGDPGFIEKLLCGAAAGLRLDSVDAVLRFMGEPPLGPVFACEVDAYLSITGTPAQRLGIGALGEASFVSQLRAGHAPELGEVDRVRRWMGMHSSAAQRRAIAAATLFPQWWRADFGEAPERDAALRAGHGCTCRGALPRYLDTCQAAEMVGMSPRTLEYYRTTGQGPAYFKLGGRVRYAVEDIERWVRARRRYRTRGDGRSGPRRAATTRESIDAS